MVSGKNITIMGNAFKKDTGDTRETAAAHIIKNLLEEHAMMEVFFFLLSLWSILSFVFSISQIPFGYRFMTPKSQRTTCLWSSSTLMASLKPRILI